MKKYYWFFAMFLTFLFMVSADNVYSFSQMSEDSQGNNPHMYSQQGTSDLSGKVIETMDSGGYTYIHIEKGGSGKWVAVPRTEIKVGQDISFQPGIVMTDFTSKTLNRTFDTIVFSSGTAGNAGKESAGDSSESAQKTESTAKKIKVEKAAGPGAYTVAELYENSGDLDKKDVMVRGQVVKFSPKIMGKNWIHIQDGTGTPSEGTHDILVTSQDELSVDDIVTVKGTLFKDKDFGGRYKYAVIIEQASVRKEK